MKFSKRAKVKRSFSLQKHRRKINRISRFLTPVLVFLVLSLGTYTVFYKIGYFNISNIEVEGTKSFVNEIDLMELVKSRSYDQNLFLFDTQNLSGSLSKDFQGAKKIEVYKKYPNTLLIKVTERVPLAIIHNSDKTNYFLVDDEGYVLGIVNPDTSNFPKIFYDNDIEVGYFLEKDDINLYFQVISATDEVKIRVNSASIYDKYLIMIVENDVEVLLSKEKDIGDSVNALATLLAQLKSQSKNVAKIDLRYDKVIVSYR